MVHTRESRAYAQERKFVLDAATGERVRDWARTRLEPDPHGSGPFADEYHTSSLYFDNSDFDVFHRRRSFGRAKYRIRRYSGADYAFLERKLRRPNLLVKRRTQIGLELVSALEHGQVNRDSPARWFHERLQVRRLVPSCLVSYHRVARAVGTSAGPARLTIDNRLHARGAQDFALVDAGTTGAAILAGQMILELKYRGRLPKIFLELLRTFRLQGQPASKYRLGMMSLGHQPAAADSLESAEINAAGS